MGVLKAIHSDKPEMVEPEMKLEYTEKSKTFSLCFFFFCVEKKSLLSVSISHKKVMTCSKCGANYSTKGHSGIVLL